MGNRELNSREVSQEEKKRNKELLTKIGFIAISLVLGFITVLVINY